MRNWTIYGLFNAAGECFYVGGTLYPDVRAKAHRRKLPVCCRKAGVTCEFEFRSLSVIDGSRALDSQRAEGYWILRLRHEGHPVVNHTLEGWPKEAMTNRKDWWPVIEAWAATKGIVVLDTTPKFLTLTQAAKASKRSKQYVALCARDGRIAGAVQVQGRWVIPKTFVIDAGPPIMKTRQEAVARAFVRMAGGMTAYAAAKAENVNVGSIYRAIKREREKLEKQK
jgi:hypothetical protein